MGVPTYRDISHGGVEYTIGSILFKENLVEFLVDRADWAAIKDYAWHYSSNMLATTVTDPVTGKREVYLHTMLLAPSPTEIVQHISGNGLDNRRCNLRRVDKAQASQSQRAKKKRNVELPPLCGIEPDQIPRHIWFVQANGYHRARFAIEFKTEKVLWKSTSSKQVSLKEKLDQATAKLAELYVQYPHLDPAHEEELIRGLSESFDEAMQII